jgi:transcriptional regulator with XRE-family HTH domain
MTFGTLLRQLREEKSLRQVDVANAIGVSTVYICDIEKDRRNPPGYKKLQLIAGKLELTEEKTAELFDLAGRARGEVAPDIIAYLVANPAVQATIRQTMLRERNV